MNRAKSAAMRLLQGNPGKRPLDLSTDVNFRVGAPAIPKDMKGVALAHWRSLVPVLIEGRVLTPADGSILELTCQAYAYMKMLQRECDKKKSIVYEQIGAAGQKTKRRHVEFDLLDRAERKYFRYLSEFGLTPATRTRVKAMPSAKTTGIAEFFTQPK